MYSYDDFLICCINAFRIIHYSTFRAAVYAAHAAGKVWPVSGEV